MTINKHHSQIVERILLPLSASINDAMECINRTLKGIVLIVNQERRLISTITDGDIRRALLHGMMQSDSLDKVIETKPSNRITTAPVGTSDEALIELMTERGVRQVPLLDAEGRVCDLACLDDLVVDSFSHVQAVVMAGGYGRRLRPLTEDTPKPMLEVADRPLLEHMIDHLRESGIGRICLSTHYHANVIQDHFRSGEKMGVDISYVQEEQPMGTAGALALMDVSVEGPLLVVNGDILTKVDFKQLLAFHQEHKAALTVGVRAYDVPVPYGVVEVEGVHVRQLREKPVLKFNVNAGIYLMEPEIRKEIPLGRKMDMTDLIDILIEQGRTVVCFPIHEYWMDIGTPEDYARVNEDLRSGKF